MLWKVKAHMGLPHSRAKINAVGFKIMEKHPIQESGNQVSKRNILFQGIGIEDPKNTLYNKRYRVEKFNPYSRVFWFTLTSKTLDLGVCPPESLIRLFDYRSSESWTRTFNSRMSDFRFWIFNFDKGSLSSVSNPK